MCIRASHLFKCEHSMYLDAIVSRCDQAGTRECVTSPAYFEIERICPGCSASMIAGRAAQFRSIVNEHEQAMYRLLNQTRNTNRDAVLQEIADREEVDNKMFEKTKAYGDLAAAVITDFKLTWNARQRHTDWVIALGETVGDIVPHPGQEGLTIYLGSEIDENGEVEWEVELELGEYEVEDGVELMPDGPEGVQGEVVPDENLSSNSHISSSPSSSPSSAPIAFTDYDDDAVWNFAP